MPDPRERVLREVDALRDEVVAFTSDLIRIPTVNPPGEGYEDCARFIGGRLSACGFEVEYHPGRRPARAHARPIRGVNVVGARRGSGAGPVVHLNGHFDVVPAGAGLDRGSLRGSVRERPDLGPRRLRHEGGPRRGGLRGGGPSARRRRLPGAIEVSGTVDEESGGFAGVAWLAETGAHRKVPHRLRDHPGAAQRRPHLHRAPRRATGSRSRPKAASLTAACRSSA